MGQRTDRIFGAKPMVPHESALCTIGSEYISLGSFVRHRHWEGFCPSGAMVGPLRVAPERRSEGYGMVQIP